MKDREIVGQRRLIDALANNCSNRVAGVKPKEGADVATNNSLEDQPETQESPKKRVQTASKANSK